MGHHGNHLEFCGQYETCFWGHKIFPIKYIYYSKNDGFLEQVKTLYKVSSYLEVKMY